MKIVKPFQEIAVAFQEAEKLKTDFVITNLFVVDFCLAAFLYIDSYVQIKKKFNSHL